MTFGTVTYTCHKCKVEKALDKFSAAKTQRGHKVTCKECCAARVMPKGKDIEFVKASANREAILELIENHQKEFGEIRAKHYRRVGIDIKYNRWINASQLAKV